MESQRKRNGTGDITRARGAGKSRPGEALTMGARITSQLSQITNTRDRPHRESSRPTPCFSVITAFGQLNLVTSNGSPPRKRQSSIRAFNSGSSGEVNGNLSIITNDNVAARHTLPEAAGDDEQQRCQPSPRAVTVGLYWFPLATIPAASWWRRNCSAVAHHGVPVPTT